MKSADSKPRSIKSFVRRQGRLTEAQNRALENNWDKHGITLTSEPLNIPTLFGRHAPLVLDIGVGTGDSTAHHARQHPHNNYLAIEVHRPGIGQLLNVIEQEQLQNIKIINDDVITVLESQLPDRCISQVFIFFPDPWPKKRHQKRRLINPLLIDLLKQKLTAHGRLHIATDWEAYAMHIAKLCENDPALFNAAGKNNLAPRPNWRVNTRYELRGKRLQHDVWDFCYGLV